ncbi:MAG: GNAT family N-acetyltransferase [Bacilli bacterium]|nr:GNAT family N-acetyltransferase [Bacilli bacterium]
MEIRQYQDHDLESLNELLNEYEFGFQRKGVKKTSNKEIVAVVDQHIVGYAVLNQLYDNIQNINYGYINYVCVLKKFQNQKIATKMFHYIFEICKNERISYLELTSNPSRVAAHHLYEKLGFIIRKTDVFRKEIL